MADGKKEEQAREANGPVELVLALANPPCAEIVEQIVRAAPVERVGRLPVPEVIGPIEQGHECSLERNDIRQPLAREQVSQFFYLIFVVAAASAA